MADIFAHAAEHCQSMVRENARVARVEQGARQNIAKMVERLGKAEKSTKMLKVGNVLKEILNHYFNTVKSLV